MSNDSSIKRCICILTSKITDVKKEIISGIYDQIGDDTDIWLMVDKSVYDEETENFIKDKNVMEFTWNEFKTSEKYVYYNVHHIRDFIGNCHLPLLKFYDEHNDYDYYMFYEDDLLLTLDIQKLYDDIFNKFGHEDVYFLREPWNINKDVHWWWITDDRSDYKLPKRCTSDKQLHLVLNMYVLSNKALNCLSEEIQSKHWWGHHELLVPSILATNNFKFVYYDSLLADYVLETREDKINRHFKRCISYPGSYYHPIKNMHIYHKINFMIKYGPIKFFK